MNAEEIKKLQQEHSKLREAHEQLQATHKDLQEKHKSLGDELAAIKKHFFQLFKPAAAASAHATPEAVEGPRLEPIEILHEASSTGDYSVESPADALVKAKELKEACATIAKNLAELSAKAPESPFKSVFANLVATAHEVEQADEKDLAAEGLEKLQHRHGDLAIQAETIREDFLDYLKTAEQDSKASLDSSAAA